MVGRNGNLSVELKINLDKLNIEIKDYDERLAKGNQYKNEFYDVENLALRFYSLHEGLNGMHCENSLG